MRRSHWTVLSRRALVVPSSRARSSLAVGCDRAQVSRQGGGAPSVAPGTMGGGFKLPDAGPAAPDAGVGSPGGGPAVGPADPGGQACAMEAHQAQRLPVDLLLLLDSSVSMEEKVPGDARTKGALVTEAMTSFVQDPRPRPVWAWACSSFPAPGGGAIRRARHARCNRLGCQSDVDCGPGTVCRLARECVDRAETRTGQAVSRGRASARHTVATPSTGRARARVRWTPPAARSRRCSCYPPGQPCRRCRDARRWVPARHLGWASSRRAGWPSASHRPTKSPSRRSPSCRGRGDAVAGPAEQE